MSALLLLPCALIALAPAAAAAASQPPLRVVIFFESLCPDCQRFMSGGFARAWLAVPEILNVTLVPWGFATATRDGGRWRFRCQHGPDECRGNRLHACGVLLAPLRSIAVDFSVCLESQQVELDCADRVGLDPELLKQCMNDPATDDVMVKYRDMTVSERPAIDEVPTVSLDGSQRGQDAMQDNFLRYVCEVWQGAPPPGCLQLLDIQ